jgi:hypothetical protein
MELKLVRENYFRDNDKKVFNCIDLKIQKLTYLGCNLGNKVLNEEKIHFCRHSHQSFRSLKKDSSEICSDRLVSLTGKN